MNSLVTRNIKLSVLLLFCALILASLFYSATLEDAQITYRYALRIWEGYPLGFWNRVGPPVEGFTSFLWTIALSLAGPDLNSIAHLSKILGIASYIGIISVLLLASRDVAQGGSNLDDYFPGQANAARRAFLFSTLAMAVNLPFAWYVTSGMETALFAFFLTAFIFEPFLSSGAKLHIVVGILLVLTRLEGVLVVIAATLYFYQSTGKRKYLFSLASFLIVFAAISIFRFQSFGYVMPNT